MAPLPKDAPHHGDVARQSFIPIGPNGNPFMPIFRFRIRNVFNRPKKHVWALWESPGGGKDLFFVHFQFVSWYDLTLNQFPFLRQVI